MKDHYDYIIVGGGIVGVSTAYKLALKMPNSSILILEKEKKFASHQTGNNSGVIHSGIYYKPGSLKLKNCINGRKQLVDFAVKNKISHEICGKLIIASEKDEIKTLLKIYENGIANGLTDIKLLNSEESKNFEPYVKCLKSIYVPYAGIIDYVEVVEKLAKRFKEMNKKNRITKSSNVISIKNKNDKKIISTKDRNYSTTFAIFVSGLQADNMALMDGLSINQRIVPFRGDYYNLTKSATHKVKGLIYPVPNINLPFLGVHLTKVFDGSVEAGPNAVFSFKKEGYRRTSFDFKDTIKSLSFLGVWKLFFSYWKIGLNEYIRAFSKKMFLNSLRKLVPSLEMHEIKRGKSGVRAQALDKDGNLVDDFLIEETINSLHVINAPSPAATACLAIADEIVKRVLIKNKYIS